MSCLDDDGFMRTTTGLCALGTAFQVSFVAPPDSWNEASQASAAVLKFRTWRYTVSY